VRGQALYDIPNHAALTGTASTLLRRIEYRLVHELFHNGNSFISASFAEIRGSRTAISAPEDAEFAAALRFGVTRFPAPPDGNPLEGYG
jgi:hypothetical protein